MGYGYIRERLAAEHRIGKPNITSLADGKDRLAVVVEMTVGGEGALGGADLYRAMVRNRAKLAYNSVAGWLEGEGPPPARLAAVPGLAGGIRLQDTVARKLMCSRCRHGALNLQTPEARPVFEDGRLAGIEAQRHNRATRLIEDMMIAANEATARYLRAAGFPSMRRVLRAPERWGRIVDLAKSFRETLPPEPDAAALEEFLKKRREADQEGYPDLSLVVVKLLGRGEYLAAGDGAAVPGHFALASDDYTHSTAPNRRYPDLITQRLLKAVLSKQAAPYTVPELERLAAHCTAMEDTAKKVERLVLKAAAALLLKSRIGERFEAIVTGASPKGTWVRIFKPVVEGKLAQGFAGLDVGDRVTVRLVRADAERGYIDFDR